MSVRKTLRKSIYGDSIGLHNLQLNDLIKYSPRQLQMNQDDQSKDDNRLQKSFSISQRTSGVKSKTKRSTSINVQQPGYNTSEVDMKNYEKNANNYQHLYNPNNSPDTTRGFAFSLRSPYPLLSRRNSPSRDSSPPKCFEEQTNKNYINSDFKINRERFDHLIRHRIGPSIGHTQLSFEVGLRNYDNEQIEAQREKQWDPTQYKDNQSKTLFLPSLKQELKLKRTIKSPEKRNLYQLKKYMKNFQIDALQNMKFILGSILFNLFFKNQRWVSQISRIFREDNKKLKFKTYQVGDKNLQQLRWELNLNSYQQPKNNVIENENDE